MDDALRIDRCAFPLCIGHVSNISVVGLWNMLYNLETQNLNYITSEHDECLLNNR